MLWLENKQLIHQLLILAMAITSCSPVIHKTGETFRSICGAQISKTNSFMIASLLLLSVRLQAHFDNVQRISDSTTLPIAMHDLFSWIMEELDILQLIERLLQGKGGDSSVLTPRRSSAPGRGLKF
jgi:hypothetical protein